MKRATAFVSLSGLLFLLCGSCRHSGGEERITRNRRESEMLTNENSRPLVGPEATPSVRLRRRQESYLGMVKSPFLTWPSVRP